MAAMIDIDLERTCKRPGPVQVRFRPHSEPPRRAIWSRAGYEEGRARDAITGSRHIIGRFGLVLVEPAERRLRAEKSPRTARLIDALFV